MEKFPYAQNKGEPARKAPMSLASWFSFFMSFNASWAADQMRRS